MEYFDWWRVRVFWLMIWFGFGFLNEIFLEVIVLLFFYGVVFYVLYVRWLLSFMFVMNDILMCD